MAKRRSRHDLLDTVQDKGRACVDRGEAIVELVDDGMSQVAIAESARLSAAAISHLKTCFLHLKGQAREMCLGGKMNADACYSLASNSGDHRERIFQCAIKIRETKDAQRTGQHIGSKGKQTPLGQITDQDMKEAIQIVGREPASKSPPRSRPRTEFHKTLVRRRTGSEPADTTEGGDVPREILAELKAARLKAREEAEQDEREYFQQIRKDEETKLKRGTHERRGRSPSGCIEDRPTARTTHFAGAYIDLTAVAAASALSANRISRTLSGKAKLTLDVARKVSEALGMGIEDFINALDKRAALQQGLRKRGLTDDEIWYAMSEGWKRGFKPPNM